MESKNNFGFKQLIELLDLQPHPEGGYFKQTYKSSKIVRPSSCDSDLNCKSDSDSDSDRSASTCVYYLLEKDDEFASFHRLKSDEYWFLQAGGPLIMHLIDPDTKKAERIILGDPFEFPDSTYQAIIRRNQWYAAELDPQAK